jgi:hypothetical protein
MLQRVRHRIRHLLCAALTICASQTAWAQHDVGFSGGYNLVDDIGSIGLFGHFTIVPIGSRARLQAYPNVDFFVFDSGFKRYGIDFDLVIPVELGTFFEPYAGLGVGITHTNTFPGTETVGDLNLLGGFAFDTSTPFRPFVEIDAALFGTDVITLTIGLGYTWGAPEEAEEPEDFGVGG